MHSASDKLKSLQLIITHDGSSSVFNARLNEHYHSIHGAYTESMHVFINAGLHLLPVSANKEIHILEVGFGTGLNAWLTAIHTLHHNLKFHYLAIEYEPLDRSIIDQINYPEHSHNAQATAVWTAIHDAPWAQNIAVHSRFTLCKQRMDWTAEKPAGQFDLIYYDAFAPNKQPEMWTPALLERCYSLLNRGGIWVTYTSKGDVRRELLAAGYEVEKIPGPPGKREMLRAIKV